ncbi:MAG: PQQ-dependent sugar dehydrogenase [Flavobacteriales bacterium]|jgi:glucose/arabinose dehydrogenase|nr:PQQ-dependent sugar dehydrogenase [Flavobacteriales bacterium]
MKHLSIFIFLIFLVSCDKDDISQKEEPETNIEYQHETLHTGFQNPWALDFLPNNEILITERPGKLSIFSNGQILSVSGLPSTIKSTGQGGLMDILVHESNGNNHTLFFSATNEVNGQWSTAIFRGNLDRENLNLNNISKIYQVAQMTTTSYHFGSRIWIENNQYIYLTLGENGMQNEAQDNSNALGTIVRLNLDGSIPADNPFVGNNSALNEIWSYGHRNIQGLAIHPETNAIWTHEHGPLGGDEVNIIQKGGNYGWPIATYGKNYNGTTITDSTHIQGTIQPEIYWTPSIAPCGMTFCTGKAFPQWKNHVFVGALAKQHINRLAVEGGKLVEKERMFQDFGRFRAIKESPEGHLYILSEGNGGKLSRIIPKK